MSASAQTSDGCTDVQLVWNEAARSNGVKKNVSKMGHDIERIRQRGEKNVLDRLNGYHL